MLSLQEISDRMEISQVLIAYSTAIDTKNFAALAHVFTSNAYIDYTAFGGIAGDLATITRWFEANKYPFGWQHLIANADIRLNGDTATGRIMCFNPMVLGARDNHGEPPVGFHGLWYIDSYVRTPEGWRISSRSEERCFSFNFPPGAFGGARPQ